MNPIALYIADGTGFWIGIILSIAVFGLMLCSACRVRWLTITSRTLIVTSIILVVASSTPFRTGSMVYGSP